MTLTPALSALLLGRTKKPDGWFFTQVNRGINGIRGGYARLLPQIMKVRYAIIAAFVIALGLTYVIFTHLPTAFVPDEDQGYFIVIYQLPQGASLDQTTAVGLHVEDVIKQQPEVASIFDIQGFSFAGSGPNQGLMFVLLKPWHDRKGPAHTLNAVLGRLTIPAVHDAPGAGLRVQSARDQRSGIVRRLPVHARGSRPTPACRR